MIPHICRDFGRPGCLGEVDEAYTMRFDNIGEAPIYWCTWCGQQSQAIEEIINTAFATIPGFADSFEAEIKRAERSGGKVNDGMVSRQSRS